MNIEFLFVYIPFTYNDDAHSWYVLDETWPHESSHKIYSNKFLLFNLTNNERDSIRNMLNKKLNK